MLSPNILQALQATQAAPVPAGQFRPKYNAETGTYIGPNGETLYATQSGGSGSPLATNIIGQGMPGENGVTYLTEAQHKKFNDALLAERGGQGWEDMLTYTPLVFSALLGGVAAGGMAAGGAGGAAGAGSAGAGVAGGLGAADLAGLAAMAADAGLTGSAAQAFIASGGTLGSTAAGAGGLAGLVGDAAWGVNPQAAAGAFPSNAAEIAAANQAAAAGIGETVATGTSGTLGAGGLSEGWLAELLQGIQNVPPGTTTALQQLGGSGGGNSLAEFQQTLQQSGVMGDQGGLSQLFNQLDSQSLTNLVNSGASGASALSRLFSGDATAADYASLLGTIGQAGLGIAAGLQQSNSTSALGDRILNMGAPSLARYEASFQPGFDIFQQPGYQQALDTSWDTGLRKLSTQGNPFGDPGALTEANKSIMGSLGLPALQNYRETNRAAGFGNVPQYAALGSQAIGQQGGAWEAAGAGLENLLNPRRQNMTLNLGDYLA